MRRSYLLLVWTCVLGACADVPPPRIGVAVSTAPAQAAGIAASELDAGDAGSFDAVIRASATGAEQAIGQAYAFVNDPRVLAVVGHGNSAASLAASQIYNTAGLVQIAPTTTAPVYGRAGPFSFRLVPGDSLQAAYLSMVRSHHWPASRVAVVHVNDDYGRGLLRVLRPQLDSVVYEGLYADNGSALDIERLRDGIAARNPELLLWAGRPHVLGLLLPLLRETLPDIAVVCGDACDAAQVYHNTDGRFTGIHFVRFTDPAASDSASRSFRDRYLEVTGEVASSEALLTYDAVSLVRAALRDGARTREGVRQYLTSLGTSRPAFVGLTGSIAFDETGACERSYMLAEVRADGVSPAEHVAGHGGH
ncbi:MAG: ABC transporter substrate-binding protein [Gemmatimonadetes bacterium]|nr:ABC transporter substrate-binding protein [Gemmatimonadota bacterium]